MDIQTALNYFQIHESELILLADKNGAIIATNDNLCEATGYRLEELIGKPFSFLLHPDVPKAVVKDVLETVLYGEVWEGYLKKLTKFGQTLLVYSTIQPNYSGGFLTFQQVIDQESAEPIYHVNDYSI